MSEPRLSNPRKGLRSEQRLPQVRRSSQPLSKKQKLPHPRGSRIPAAFWDNLSKIWLTERSLKELDRRKLGLDRHTDEPTGRSLDTRLLNGRTTRKDIKLLARHGGLDLSNLGGYQQPVNPLNRTMSSIQTSSRGQKRGTANTKPATNTTRNVRPYDCDFQQNLIDGGVYPDEYELAQPRPSLSPSQFSDDKFRKFKRADTHAHKERHVMESVILIIKGEIKDTKCVSGGIPFTNLDHLTDGSLVPSNPDRYYGARPEQLNRQIRKGPDGSISVVGRQASYDGTLGARGVHSLQSYGQDKAEYDENAYTITSTYHGGQLKMYTSHPAQSDSPGSRPEYYMNQINTWGMTGNAETFRQGATAFRNTRDWTKEQRDKAIRYANDRANGITGATQTSSAFATSFTTEVSTLVATTSLGTTASHTSETAQQESETSTDELARDVNPPAKRSSRSRQPRHRKRSKGVSRARQSSTADET
ncbi:hypothetical protein BJ875DRAFT_508725 [Amylocarpus encephaloides]|uniref:Uncharacterized protein n=1 Tax=Amylocarpus encephaloides TaxID=45428 RepID=A0A9P7Y5W5_9HELO|nr:hypothetical protein BJ875DRAFT_508725 [Amylocarpus encephaloides]